MTCWSTRSQLGERGRQSGRRSRRSAAAGRSSCATFASSRPRCRRLPASSAINTCWDTPRPRADRDGGRFAYTSIGRRRKCGRVTATMHPGTEQPPRQTHFKSAQQSTLQAPIRLRAGDEVGHHLTNRRAFTQRIQDEADESGLEESRFEPGGAFELGQNFGPNARTVRRRDQRPQSLAQPAHRSARRRKFPLA